MTRSATFKAFPPKPTLSIMSNLQLIGDAVDKYADKDKSPFANKFMTLPFVKYLTLVVQFAHAFSGLLGLRELIVVDNHHREDAAFLQRIASLARPWKLIRQYAILRDTIPLNIATASSQPRRAPASTCRDQQRQRGQPYTCGRVRAFRKLGAILPGQKRRQAVVHKLLEGEVFAREHAIMRKDGPVAQARVVNQVAAVEDEVAAARGGCGGVCNR
ncbi:hypothetical protein EDB86DRAFT_1957124 [Lactarius hatsudake]|nr:hypothetical protein EDB86DRAFT_1957124 [Lactarius hatsudake]